MKLKLFLTVFLLAGVTVGAQATDGMDKKQLSRYYGTMRCVDYIFFNGGYTIGDKKREAIMNEVLRKHRLPSYNEEIYSTTKEESAQIDTSAYVKARIDCLDDQGIAAIEKKYGVSAEY